MKRPFPAAARLAAAALMLAGLAGCVAPVGPVEVTRFHLPDTSQLGRGTISVEPAPGMDGLSLEYRSYAAAVARELTRVGYTEQRPGLPGSQFATVSITRDSIMPGPAGSPVSVGVGGSAGSHGSGMGVGIGLDLSGPPPEQIETTLAVSIRDRASSRVLWEGRARFRVRATSPLADTQLGAAKLAEALFRGFPGQSGETILVK